MNIISFLSHNLTMLSGHSDPDSPLPNNPIEDPMSPPNPGIDNPDGTNPDPENPEDPNTDNPLDPHSPDGPINNPSQ